MDKHKFFVEKLRFHLKEKDTLVFVGWFFDGSTKDHSLEAYMDGEKLPMELQINRGAQVRQKYIRSINQIDEEVVGIVTLPPDWRERGVFRLRAFYREQETKAYRIRRAGLLRLEQEISYYVESCRRSAGRVTVSGWCMADGEVKLDLLNAARQPISEKVEHYCRKDLLSVFPEYDGEGKPGFSISAKVGEREAGPFFLEMRNASRMSRTRLYKWENGTRGQYLLEKAGDAARYFRRNGLSATVYKVQSKLLKKDANTYENWRKKYAVTPEELAAQREQRFSKRGVLFDRGASLSDCSRVSAGDDRVGPRPDIRKLAALSGRRQSAHRRAGRGGRKRDASYGFDRHFRGICSQGF